MRSPTLLLTLACTLVACSGSDNGGPVDSGLPAERKGSELTEAEATQLCEARAEQLSAQLDTEDFKHQYCVFAGIAAAALGGGMVSTCETFYDMCMKMDFKPTDSGAACMLGFELSTCDATVTVLEDCFTEQNDATAAAFKAASCDDLGKEPMESTSGPACTKAQASCPGVG
ncbi:MAG: hypothetical protein H0T76_06715 [Nannocystis sp.]|nr:hypothetical protein [Nannocystis sp.]MBA3546154.1 hypothetical protein [Nannocystis sp.]